MSELSSPHSLPWEVLDLVFSVSPPSTLAVLGGVSMDFLESTAPLLYQHVEITSVKALELLFCSRKVETYLHVKSQVDQLLSLSTIRILSLDFSSPACAQTFLPSELSLSDSRVPKSSFLPLDLLHITADSDHTDILPLLHVHLLPRLAPIRLNYTLVNRPSFLSSEFYIGGPRLPITTFPHVDVLSLNSFIPYILNTRDHPGVYLLAGLQRPRLDRRRIVRLRLSSLLSDEFASVASFIADQEELSDILDCRRMQEGSIVFVVETEKEKREAEEAVGEMDQRWRSKFAVELEA